jgi:hypothetical protein
MKATAMDSGVLVMALAVIREVGYSSARISHVVVNTKNRLGAATSHRVMMVAVMAIMVVAVEAHVSAL